MDLYFFIFGCNKDRLFRLNHKFSLHLELGFLNHHPNRTCNWTPHFEFKHNGKQHGIHYSIHKKWVPNKEFKLGPDEPMTMPLYTDKPRWFHRTWNVCPAIVELQHPQSPDREMSGQMDRWSLFYDSPDFPLGRCGTIIAVFISCSDSQGGHGVWALTADSCRGMASNWQGSVS